MGKPRTGAGRGEGPVRCDQNDPQEEPQDQRPEQPISPARCLAVDARQSQVAGKPVPGKAKQP